MNSSEDMSLEKRLVVLAVFVNLVLFWFIIGLLFTGDDHTGLPLVLAPLLWLACFPVMLVGYVEKREPASRRICRAGLITFAVMLVCTGYCVWYHSNGVWQPWQDLAYANVSSVELRGRLDAGVTVLTEEEQQKACELVSGLRVQNPNVFTWGEMRIPSDMPPLEGVWTDTLLFWKGNGEYASLTVGYPYYNWSHLAADLDKAKEVEAFVNSLSEKYK